MSDSLALYFFDRKETIAFVIIFNYTSKKINIIFAILILVRLMILKIDKN